MMKLYSYRDNEGNLITVNLFALVAVIQPSILSSKKVCTVAFQGITSNVDMETAENIKTAIHSLTTDPMDQPTAKRESHLIS